MESLQVDVVRALSAPLELRAAVDDSLGTLSGYFSAHDTWYEVDSMWEGKFLERTANGFAEETIAEDRDSMRVLFDHGFDTIGNKVLGPIDVLESRSKGPYYEVPLFDTTYNRELLPGLKAGVYGASFRMRVTADEWDDEPKASRHNPNGIPERTITRAKVMEFGPVTFPANPKASASVRSVMTSVTDQFYDRLRQRDTNAFEAAVRAAGRQLPDFTGMSDARSTDAGDSDAEPRSGTASTVSNSNRTRDRVLRMAGVIK
jgi:phage head maturation protease